MITVYHLSSSRSERIVWLLEELELPYALETLQREPTGAAPAALKALHPLGKAPVIREGDLLLAESGAIVDYIIQRHGGGRLALRPEHPEFAQYIYWMHFAEGSLMTLMLIALTVLRMPEAASSAVRVRVLDRMDQMVGYVDARLAGRRYFAGDELTAADVMMVFPFTTLRYFLDFDLAPYPAIVSYLERIQARPAYRKAMSLAGPTGQRYGDARR